MSVWTGLKHLARGAAVCALLAAPAAAQGLFSPVVTVNDDAVTAWELDQRIRLLEAFRQRGDLPTLALEGLIDDRLKQAELARVGLALSDEGVAQALEEFAGRANLTLEQFLATLASAGVEEQTLRDFVITGVSWRDYIRARYRDRVDVTENDIVSRISLDGAGGSEIEVLLSEIIIPAPPPQAAAAQAAAERIARLTSQAAFSAEAARVSALPSRANGGRLDWVPVTNFPEGLRPVLLALATNEVTAPIPIPNGIALFQLRDLREVARPAATPTALDYAAYYIQGGQSAAAQAEAARLRAAIDVCDDLYGVAQDQPDSVLDRALLPLSEIPQDVALELAKLDPGEVSTALTRADGQTLVFLMLCERRYGPLEPELDRDAVERQLQAEQLAGYAEALIADLRASATIVRY